MTRTIPYVHSGGITEHISLADLATSVPPPPSYPSAAVTHRAEPLDADDAMEFAKGAAIGGAMLTCAIAMAAVGCGLLTGEWFRAGVAFFAAPLAVPGMYLGVYFVRFADRRAKDNRVLNTLPPPRPYVETKGKAVIEAKALPPERDVTREVYGHKLMACALRAASVMRNEAGKVVKEYGAAPLVRRDGRGATKEREIAFEVEGVKYTISQEEQEVLHGELAKIGILVKRTNGWGLADPTWTRQQVIDRMEAALCKTS